MFGRNKISQEEIERLKNKINIDNGFFAEMEDQKDMFDASVAELAESRIRDADMAKEMVEYSKNQILTEASSAMLAQSLNVNRSAVAKLLG